MFISRKLLPHEKNYAKVEKECLAIKWAVEKLKYYLLGRKCIFAFILFSSNGCLKTKEKMHGSLGGFFTCRTSNLRWNTGLEIIMLMQMQYPEVLTAVGRTLQAGAWSWKGGYVVARKRYGPPQSNLNTFSTTESPIRSSNQGWATQ